MKIPFLPKSLLAKRILWCCAGAALLFILYGVARILLIKPLTLKPGEPLRGRLRTESKIHHIGDPVMLTLEIESAPKVRYSMPNLNDLRLAPFEVQAHPELRREWLLHGERRLLRLQVIAWESGRFTLSGPELSYVDAHGRRRSYRVPSLNVAITSVLPVKRSKAELLKLPLKPMKGPVGLPPRYALLGWAAVLVALAALIYGVIRLVKKRTAAPGLETPQPEPRREAAHQIALRRLAALEAAQCLNAEEFRSFYGELSEIARQYIEERFEIKAMEMTSEEFLMFIAATDSLKIQHQFLLREFLRSSDLVKFAQSVPLPDEARLDLERIRQLVRETVEPVPEPTAEAASDPVPSAV